MTGTRVRQRLQAAALMAALLLPQPGWAQLSTPFVGDNDQPIAISADGDIEWNRAGKYYIARGNAQASQGDVFIQAQTLQAFYREEAGAATSAGANPLAGGSGQGNSTIYKLLAEGDVYIKSGADVLVGEKLEYLIEEERATVTGKLIILATAQGSVSARSRIIYDSKQLYAVAEGNAQVQQNNNIVGADRLTAYFYPQGQQAGGQQAGGQPAGGGSSGSNPIAAVNLGGGRIRLVEASGKVELTDGKSYAVADFGRYEPESQRAYLTCRVKVTQGSNQLTGDYAEYNFGSGEARVQSRAVDGCPTSSGRSFILIDPKTGNVQQLGRP